MLVLILLVGAALWLAPAAVIVGGVVLVAVVLVFRAVVGAVWGGYHLWRGSASPLRGAPTNGLSSHAQY